MLYRDVNFFNKDYNLTIGDISVDNGIVTEIKEKGQGSEKAILPPFVDIHIHGGYGVDIMNSVSSEIVYLSKCLYRDNVGAYMPTTVAKSYNKILGCAKEIKAASLNREYAEIIGVHIEGPFISPQYKGIMEDKFIVPCDIKLYQNLKEIMGDLKIRFTIAPECEGAMEFAEYVVKNGDYISIGHSGGTFQQCESLVNAGAKSYTHLFNAMSGLHHREVGVVGAGLMDNSFVEVICDFVHISKEAVEIATRLKKNKIILITDAMEAMGYKNGKYEFCGKEVEVYKGAVKDGTGRLAGSVLTMKKAVENMAGIAGFDCAVKMASENPAKLLNLKKYGCIDIGKRVIL